MSNTRKPASKITYAPTFTNPTEKEVEEYLTTAPKATENFDRPVADNTNFRSVRNHIVLSDTSNVAELMAQFGLLGDLQGPKEDQMQVDAEYSPPEQGLGK